MYLQPHLEQTVLQSLEGDNKYGYFPSAAFAWRANNEPFIKNTNLFNELKFRVGWGQTGNQAIRPYQTLANYGPELVAGPGNTTSNRLCTFKYW